MFLPSSPNPKLWNFGFPCCRRLLDSARAHLLFFSDVLIWIVDTPPTIYSPAGRPSLTLAWDFRTFVLLTWTIIVIIIISVFVRETTAWWQTGAMDGRAHHSGGGDIKETRNNLANHFGWSVQIAINLDNARNQYVGILWYLRFIDLSFVYPPNYVVLPKTFPIFDLAACRIYNTAILLYSKH